MNGNPFMLLEKKISDLPEKDRREAFDSIRVSLLEELLALVPQEGHALLYELMYVSAQCGKRFSKQSKLDPDDLKLRLLELVNRERYSISDAMKRIAAEKACCVGTVRNVLAPPGRNAEKSVWLDDLRQWKRSRDEIIQSRDDMMHSCDEMVESGDDIAERFDEIMQYEEATHPDARQSRDGIMRSCRQIMERCHQVMQWCEEVSQMETTHLADEFMNETMAEVMNRAAYAYDELMSSVDDYIFARSFQNQKNIVRVSPRAG